MNIPRFEWPGNENKGFLWSVPPCFTGSSAALIGKPVPVNPGWYDRFFNECEPLFFKLFQADSVYAFELLKTLYPELLHSRYSVMFVQVFEYPSALHICGDLAFFREVVEIVDECF
jgi:hypothetical protein